MSPNESTGQSDIKPFTKANRNERANGQVCTQYTPGSQKNDIPRTQATAAVSVTVRHDCDISAGRRHLHRDGQGLGFRHRQAWRRLIPRCGRAPPLPTNITPPHCIKWRATPDTAREDDGDMVVGEEEKRQRPRTIAAPKCLVMFASENVTWLPPQRQRHTSFQEPGLDLDSCRSFLIITHHLLLILIASLTSLPPRPSSAIIPRPRINQPSVLLFHPSSHTVRTAMSHLDGNGDQNMASPRVSLDRSDRASLMSTSSFIRQSSPSYFSMLLITRNSSSRAASRTQTAVRCPWPRSFWPCSSRSITKRTNC